MATTTTATVIAVLTLLFTTTTTTECTQAGVQMRVTKKGMEFGINTGKRIMMQELRKRTFDENGNKAGVEYKLQGMRITDATFPEVEMMPVSGVGMRGVMRGVTLGGKGNVWYRYKVGWFRFSDSVDFSVRISGIDISIVVGVGDVREGRPQISLGECSAHVRDIDIRFKGSGFKQWIYNLFNGVIALTLETTLGSMLCKVIRNEVEQRARSALYTFPLTQPIDQWASIDYHLTAPPTFTKTYMDAFFKGQFKSRTQPNHSSLDVPNIHMTNEAEKMIYIWVSEATINSAGDVYQRSGALNVKVEQWNDKLPKEITDKLNTNTFEMAIPNLSTYRDLPMSVHFVSYNAPRVSISENNIRLYLFTDATFTIRQANGVDTEAFVLRFHMDTALQPNVVGDRITAHITGFNYDAKVVRSNIGKIDLTLLSIMKFIIEKSVINTANPKLRKGFPLPKIDTLQFKNMELRLHEKAIKIGTDALLTL